MTEVVVTVTLPPRKTDYMEERDKYLRMVLGQHTGPCTRAMVQQMSAGKRHTGLSRAGVAFFVPPDDEIFNGLTVGVIMENSADLIKAITQEVAEAKTTLEELANQVRALSDIVGPALLKQGQDLRAARMTAVTEVRATLAELREIRKFFLEADYATEMVALERFVALCRELQALKAAGVLDAVADTSIRLALKEP